MNKHDHDESEFNDHELTGDESFEKILSDYLERLNTGEILDEDQILTKHPDVGAEIWSSLEVFQMVGAGSTSSSPLGTLGDYTLRRMIGRGGMGVVYDAWQNSLERQVALKVLPAGFAADDKAFHRFMREAKTAAKLNHTNVVSVHGMGVEQNTPYYAMELVEGETLAQILMRMGDLEYGATAAPDLELPFGAHDRQDFYIRLADIFTDVADGLQHAHSKGVIHRDIKPSNLILDPDGHLRILDFGLAHLEGQESLTGSGDYMGTPLYMSPEQARRRKIPIDHRTDIYSLGATMYEMLTGRPPFRGKSNLDTLSQIIERDAVEPRKLNQRVPRDLETIVLKCLRKEAGDRYGTAEALGQDLRRFVRGDPIEARPESRLETITRRVWQHRVKLTGIFVLFLLLVLMATLARIQFQSARTDKLNRYVDLVETAALKIELGRLTKGRARVDGASQLDPLERMYLYLMRDFETILEMNQIEEALNILRSATEILPSQADAYYHLAIAQLLLGEDQRALSELSQCLERDQGHTPALALCEVMEGKEVSPKPRADELSPVDTEWVQAWKDVFRARFDGDWKTASEGYDTLLHFESSTNNRHAGISAEIVLGRGIAQLVQGNLTEAVIHFAIAHDRWPRAMEPALLLGDALLHLNDKPAAKRIFEGYIGRELINRDTTLLGIAAVYSSFGLLDEALSWVEKIQRIDLKYRSQARLLTEKRDFDGAIRAGNQAILHDPDNPANYACMLWAIDTAHIPPSETKSLCQKAISKDNKNGMAHTVLGLVLFKEGDSKGAIRELSTARQLAKKDDPIAFIYTAITYATILGRQGQKSVAVDVLKKALKEYPSDTSLNGHLAQKLEQNGNTEAALEYGERARNLNPADTWSYAIYGRRLAKLGRREEALVQIERARALGEEDSQVHWSLGWAFEYLGDLEESAKEFRQAISLDEDWLRPQYQLVSILMNLGEFEEALEVSRRIIALGGNSPASLPRILWQEGQLDEAFDAYVARIVEEPKKYWRYRGLLTFTRRADNHHEFSGKWDGLFEQLEGIRESGDQPPALLNALSVAYLNGGLRRNLKTVSELIQQALQESGRKDPDVLATRAEMEFFDGREKQAVRTLEEAFRTQHPKADWILQKRLHEYRHALLPDLASYDSIDAILRTRKPGSEGDRRLLEGFRSLDQNADERLLKYLDARILQRAGKPFEAISFFKELQEAGDHSLNILIQLVQSMRAVGSSEEAEQLLRSKLQVESHNTQGMRDLLHLWLSVCLDDLDQSPGDLSNNLPMGNEALSSVEKVTASLKKPEYISDITWLLKQLSAGVPIRINCGSKGDETIEGEHWGKDRFSVWGSQMSTRIVDIRGTEKDVIYRTARLFPWDHRAHYAIPLPLGTYEVVLHFADCWFTKPGCRHFGVSLEDELILSLHEYDPTASIGFCTAEEKKLNPVEVMDGVIDIEFVHQKGWPLISAIEVHRLDN